MKAPPISHRGQPVQFGGEKETNLKTMSAGTKLDGTLQPDNFQPGLLGQVTADMLKEGVAIGGVGQVGWEQLNDKGKAQYALKYQSQHNRFPVIRVKPNADYSEIAWEKNGWIEVVSKPYPDTAGLSNWLKTYGWGHVHTSFMRGAPPPEQKQQIFWAQMANVWCFLNSLEERGARGNGEDAWRFDIKGLSIPTEEHLDRWAEILGGRNLTATAFSKHCILNVRGNGKQYGDPNRVGTETRGGTADEKQRILDSLLNGLNNGHWGASPIERGANGFRLVRLGADATHGQKNEGLLQPSSLPSDFQVLINESLQRAPVEGIGAGDVARIFNYVKGATLGRGKEAARIGRFDQRAAIPFLNYEALPFLDDDTKKRVQDARATLLHKLDALQKANGSGTEIAQAIATWAQTAKLASVLGNWLDGPNGRQHFIEV